MTAQILERLYVDGNLDAVVERATEDYRCDWCGGPIYRGETVLLIEEGSVYCGRGCLHGAGRNDVESFLDGEWEGTTSGWRAIIEHLEATIAASTN